MTNVTSNAPNGIILQDSKVYQSPVSIASNVLVANSYVGLLGETQAWTVINSGEITSTGTDGVDLVLGGAFTDTATGTISGSLGLVVGGPSTIKVSGKITGTAGTAVSFGAATGSNLMAVYSGAIFSGIVAGSSTGTSTLEFASSASTGTISGLGTSFTNFQAINIDAASNWVVAGSNTVADSTEFLTDSGTMINTGTLTGVVTLDSGGVLTNASGGIIGNTTFAVIGTAAGASVFNAGNITAASYAIHLTQGGTVTNAAGGELLGFVGIQSGGALTLTNSGTISGSGINGVKVDAAGVITNAASAVISGSNYGIYITGSGTIQNQGTIVASNKYGIELTAAGSITNSASGTIVGDGGVYFGADGSTLLNQGTIIGTSNDGVTASSDAVIVNAAGAVIRGKNYGIYVGNNGTVINAGTIDGKGGAVTFLGTGNNLLVIDPGAVFGSFGVTANTAASSNVIELAAGTIAGAISALGTSFANFGTINVDANAIWTISSSNSIDTALLTDSGTLTNAGTFIGRITLAGDGVLTNAVAGQITNASSAVVGTGPNASIVNYGTITGSSVIPGFAIELQQGGQVTNAATATIIGSGGIVSDSKGGPATVVNSGVITGGDTAGVNFTGVYLNDGGTVTNTQFGAIYGGQNGIYVTDGAATIQNDGTISSAPAMFGGYGIILLGGGELTSSSTGHISGHGGVKIFDTAASVLNAGTIFSGPSSGVYSDEASSVTNAAGAVISAAGEGVRFTGGGGTLRNAGSITSINTLAAYLGGPSADLLVIDPGAFFGGTVTGPASIDNVMELASGSITGTLTGLGSSFSNFATIEVDTGAQWMLVTDQNTISSATVINAGTIFNAVTLGAGGILTNTAAGLITSSSGGVNAVGTGASVLNAGFITTTKFDGVALHEGGSFTNSGTIVGADVGVYLSAVSGGSITNLAGGTISAETYGIVMHTSAGTIVNAGIVSATVRDGVYLPEGGTVTNSAAGRITGFNGVVARGTVAASVINAGTIIATGTTFLNGYGVGLAAGGSITNAASGSISGAIAGVGFGLGSGTLVNSGTITGGFVGAIGISNDTFTNAAGALISGGVDGVVFENGSGTVINAGTIAATGTGSVAVHFGGTAANLMVLDPGAVDTGIVAASTSGLDTLELASGVASGSLSGLGVSFTNFGTVVIDPSIDWAAYGYNTIASGVQLIDSGKLYIEDTATNSGTITGGVGLGSGSTLTNAAGGTITGAIAVRYADMNAIATVINSGIMVGTAGYGLWLEGASTVRNAVGGQISGTSAGIYISGTGTVYNAGAIENTDTTASRPIGVFLSVGGSLTNDVGGYISGGTGVSAGGLDATLVNAGTIVGAGGTAVDLFGLFGNDLVLDPGAAFTGIVSATASATNAIELASGTSAGTITSLGTSFVNFETVTVDAGANWTLAGSNSVSASGTIIDYGTLTNTGTLDATVTLENGSTLSNDSGATIATTGVAALGSQSNVALSNGGLIESSSTYGVKLGIFVSDSIYLNNNSGGAISGTTGVYVGGPGTVINSGTIAGTTGYGVNMARGGTLLNASTIVGSNGTAAVLAGYGDNRLILDGGAVFVGTVAGGISAATNTMELAYGAGQRTISGLGVSFTNFSTVTVDYFAYWTVNGFNTVASSQTLLDDGYLTNVGTISGIVTLALDGVVTNASGGTITSLTEAVLGTSHNASVVNAGLVTGGMIGVSLMNGGQVTNQSGGLIEGAGEGGIVSDSPTLAATVVNDGTIAGGFYGVTLSSASTITNDSSGRVSGYGFGVRGTINTLFNAGTIVATGTGGVGVRLNEDNVTMVNALSGVVSGQYGVELDAIQATLITAGTIGGALGAIYLNGFSQNRLVLQPGAVIDGSVLANASAANVLELGAASTIAGPTSGTVVGLGVSFANFGSITVDATANWTATGSNTVAASVLLTDYGSLSVAGTLTNAGTIIGENTAGSAIVVTQAGTLTNASTIENTVSLDGGPLINALGGTISGGFAVRGGEDYASTVNNQGVIEGTSDGVYLAKGGLITNAAGALIDGGNVGVLIRGSAATVLNAGTITDSTVGGVVIRSGGTVSNAADALIAGVYGVGASGGVSTVTNFGTITGTSSEGVRLASGGTVVNVGTITGTNGTAVAFYGPVSNLLVIDPAAVFNGKVAGSVSATNRMELTTGASAGTITGIGSSFTNFATVTVDPSAAWTFSSTNSLVTSGNVFDLGTLINTGTLVAGRGVQVEGTAATVVNVAGAKISGAPFGIVDFGGTVVNYGTVSGGASFGIGLISGGSLTNAAGAGILSAGNGVYSNALETISNSGTIAATNDGVLLTNDGAVTNAASASISGTYNGVVIEGGAGVVANAGTVAGANYYGVWLKEGGSVTNSAAGSIVGGYDGVFVKNGAATVANAGLLTGAKYYGVFLKQGGDVTNSAGARIGGYYAGVGVTGGVGTVTNSGSISSTYNGVSFGLGGTVTNASLANIAGGKDGVYINGGAATVENSGTISGASLYGVYVNNGTFSGTAVPGTMSGHHGKFGGSTLSSGAGHHGKFGGSTFSVAPTVSALVVNAASGTIFGAYNGVYLKNVATIRNQGTIASSPTAAGTNSAAYGIFVNGGGTIANYASGLVTAFTGVDIQDLTGTLLNYGTIVGSSNYGVYSNVGSSITNAAGALIKGAKLGVDLSNGTLINAGTVIGGGGTAVAFYGTVGNLLVVDPGAVFGGIVAGSVSATNSMELASAVSAGTLIGLGTSFTSFGTVGVDAGASWHLDGANTLAEGSTLTNAGTLTLDGGATLIDASTVVNNGAIVLATGTTDLSVQALAGSGSVSIGAGSTVAVQGTVAMGETLGFAGGGNAFLVLGDGPVASGTIGGFGVGDTIDVTDLTFVGTQTTASVAANVLTVTEGGTTFTFATAGLADGAPVYALNDGDGGTDITLTPPSPSGMGLASASDSGVKGDDLTNVKLPTITGNTTPYGTVDLYQGGQLVGVGTANASGAWSVTTTTTLTEGTNSFTSTVTDTAGHLSPVSAPLTITLDTATPASPGTLTLAAASDSAVVGDDITNVTLPTLQGTAIPNGTIDLYDGTTLIGVGTSDNTGAWSVTATTTLSVGSNTLTVTATDTAGNVSGTSPSLAVTLETTAVTPTSLTLDPGSDTGVKGDDITKATLPTIDGVGAAGSTIDLYGSGGNLIGTGTVNNTGHWSVTLTTPLVSGANSITATATDVAGNVSGSSTPLVLTLDNVPPVPPTALTLASASDSGVKGDKLTNVALPAITGTAEPGSTIDLYDGSALIGVGTADNATGLWSVTATTTLAAGLNSLTATATDAAGNVSGASSTLVVTLDTAAPAAPTSLSLAAASDSGIVGDDVTNVTLPTINGTAVPFGTIDLYDGSILIGAGTADVTGKWSVAATTSLSVGQNTLTATVTDTAGNLSGASSALVVTLETAATAPNALTLAPTSDSGVVGDDLTNAALPVITGTGAVGSTIHLYDGSGLIGVGTVDANGVWSVATNVALAVGANTLTATATDVAGNISAGSPALVITLDTSIPAAPSTLTLAPTSDSGALGDHITNVTQPMITGTGVAGDSVTLRDGDIVIGTGTVGADGTWAVTTVLPLDNGTHSLSATQTSPAGNISAPSAGLSLAIDVTSPPSPGTLVLAPSSDSGVAGDDITNVARPAITGTGVAGDVVTLYDGATVIGTGTVTSAGTWSVTPVGALGDGQHTLSANQTSPAGNVSAATANLTLTIKTGAAIEPTLTETAQVTDPAKPNLIGTADIGATVTVYDGTIALGSAIADGTGHFSFTAGGALGSGTHQLTAVAVDVAGNLSVPSAPLQVIVNANHSYAVVSASDSSGTTVAHVYNTAGTLTAADTYDTGGLLLQHVGPDATVRNIYDSDGKLIGTVSGPGAADGNAPQPDFGTSRLTKGAQTATDSGASVVNLLSESNNLSTQGNDTVLAGSGSTTVSANSNAVLVAGGSGSLVFAGGSGSSTVLGGTGSSLVFGGSGGGIFQGGSAGHNVLVAGDGNTTLLGGGVGDLLLGSGSGQQLIMGNAANQTLVGGGSSATLVGAGAGGDELFGGAGASKIFASNSGADTIVAGSGSAVIVAKQGDVVFASEGVSTIFGSATGNDVITGGGTALIVGGNGNDMYAGGGGITTVFSGAGNDTLFTGAGTTTAVLGSGADNVFMGSGTATVFAGAGKDIFATFAGQSGGSTTIAGFKVGTDLLGLGGYDLSSVKQQSANGATTLTLTDNTKITILGINHLGSASIF